MLFLSLCPRQALATQYLPCYGQSPGTQFPRMVTTTVIPPSVSFPPIRFFPSDWAVVKGARRDPACLGTACAQGVSLFTLDAHIVAGMCVGTGHVAGIFPTSLPCFAFCPPTN